jgi:acylphosphatase
VKRFHMLVSGDVQGVGFRWYARGAGTSAGVTGWVRNLVDGRVELVAEGIGPVLQAFCDELRGGRFRDSIRDIEKVEEPPTGEFDGFDIRF